MESSQKYMELKYSNTKEEATLKTKEAMKAKKLLGFTYYPTSNKYGTDVFNPNLFDHHIKKERVEVFLRIMANLVDSEKASHRIFIILRNVTWAALYAWITLAVIAAVYFLDNTDIRFILGISALCIVLSWTFLYIFLIARIRINMKLLRSKGQKIINEEWDIPGFSWVLPYNFPSAIQLTWNNRKINNEFFIESDKNSELNTSILQGEIKESQNEFINSTKINLMQESYVKNILYTSSKTMTEDSYDFFKKNSKEYYISGLISKLFESETKMIEIKDEEEKKKCEDSFQRLFLFLLDKLVVEKDRKIRSKNQTHLLNMLEATYTSGISNNLYNSIKDKLPKLSTRHKIANSNFEIKITKKENFTQSDYFKEWKNSDSYTDNQNLEFSSVSFLSYEVGFINQLISTCRKNLNDFQNYCKSIFEGTKYTTLTTEVSSLDRIISRMHINKLRKLVPAHDFCFDVLRCFCSYEDANTINQAMQLVNSKCVVLNFTERAGHIVLLFVFRNVIAEANLMLNGEYDQRIKLEDLEPSKNLEDVYRIIKGWDEYDYFEFYELKQTIAEKDLKPYFQISRTSCLGGEFKFYKSKEFGDLRSTCKFRDSDNIYEFAGLNEQTLEIKFKSRYLDNITLSGNPENLHCFDVLNEDPIIKIQGYHDDTGISYIAVLTKEGKKKESRPLTLFLNQKWFEVEIPSSVLILGFALGRNDEKGPVKSLYYYFTYRDSKITKPSKPSKISCDKCLLELEWDYIRSKRVCSLCSKLMQPFQFILNCKSDGFVVCNECKSSKVKSSKIDRLPLNKALNFPTFPSNLNLIPCMDCFGTYYWFWNTILFNKESTFTCKSCQSTCSSRSGAFVCRSCCYFLCSGCALLSKKAEHTSIRNFMKKKCPTQGHYLGFQFYSKQNWECEKCRTNYAKTIGSFHCPHPLCESYHECSGCYIKEFINFDYDYFGIPLPGENVDMLCPKEACSNYMKWNWSSLHISGSKEQYRDGFICHFCNELFNICSSVINCDKCDISICSGCYAKSSAIEVENICNTFMYCKNQNLLIWKYSYPNSKKCTNCSSFIKSNAGGFSCECCSHFICSTCFYTLYIY